MSLKISLIIPSFNSETTIERTIQSIIIQDYSNLELILMDGGSQDETVSIVNKYQSYFTKIISEADQGQAHALNKGFRMATGDIFGWLCSDDELAPGALAHFAELFTKHPEINLITGGCRRLFPDNFMVETTPHQEVMKKISYQNGIEQPSTLWRASLHRSAGFLDESYNYAFDWEWWNRLQKVGANVLTTEKIMSYYYFSETNKTSTGANKLIQEMYRVIKTYGPLNGNLADIYLFLYRYFDLYGCYDNPRSGSKFRQYSWAIILRILIKLFGQEYIYSYNWNFASKQERALCWYL